MDIQPIKKISMLICPHPDAQAGEAIGHSHCKMCCMRSKGSVRDKDIQILDAKFSGLSGGI